MTLLSLLTRPISVSCLLLFGVAPLLNPSLWAASKSSAKPSKKEETKPSSLSLLSEEKEHWQLFKEISSNFRGDNPQEILKKASVFLLRWPNSPVSDSIRLMAASCASKLELYEQALGFCEGLRDTEIENQVLALRIKWLCALNRYQQAYELGLKAPIETLTAERRAWSRFYMAQALYQEAQEHYKTSQRFLETDLSHIEQAYSLYTSAQEIIGYMAVFGRASSAQTLGFSEIAASSYLKASKMPGADTAKCLYLAARLYSDDYPLKAYNLCKELLETPSEMRSQAAFLWMQTALKADQQDEILSHPEWVKAASEEDSLGAQYFFGSALAQAGRKVEAVETLTKLINECLTSPQKDIEAYAQPAIVRLSQLYKAQDPIENLATLNELLGQKGGRSQEYFYVCFKLGQLFDERASKEAALDQYARIVVQAPESAWISFALLRKGLLEADKGFYAASWASLDLYLRRHADEEGSRQAWPVFLKVTSSLNEYQGASGFNHDRFKLVLDRLKAFNGSEDQKLAFLSDEAERLYEESPDKAELLLLATQTHMPSYFTAEQELLLAMCRAKAETNVESLVAAAKPAIARETKNPAKLEVRLAKTLRVMAEKDPSVAQKAQEAAAGALVSAFKKDPDQISKEEALWMGSWVQSGLKLSSYTGDWAKYFIDPIFDRDRMSYVAFSLDEAQKQWAKETSAILQYVLNRGKADASTRLMLARLQWATGDFKGCSQTLITVHSSMTQNQNQEVTSSYLAYDCGAHILCADMQGALEVSKDLLARMQTEKDSSLAATMRVCLARACVEESAKNSTQKSYFEKTALGFYNQVTAQPVCELEPLFIEASVEKAILLGKMTPVKDTQAPSIVTQLLGIKRQYVEADNDHTKAWQERVQKDERLQKIWQSYVVLIDALLAQHQAVDILKTADSDEDRRDARTHLTLAVSLYKTLLTDKYAVTPFIKEMSSKGMKEVQSLEIK